jgi:hypothetical protein
LNALTANLDSQYQYAKERESKAADSGHQLRRVSHSGSLRESAVDDCIDGEYEYPSERACSSRERDLEDKVARLERELNAMRRDQYDADERLARQMVQERCQRAMDRWRNVRLASGAIADAPRFGELPADSVVISCAADDWWDDTLPICFLYKDPEYCEWAQSFECFQLLWDHGRCDFLKDKHPEYAARYKANFETHQEERRQQLEWCREHLPDKFKKRLPSRI